MKRFNHRILHVLSLAICLIGACSATSAQDERTAYGLFSRSVVGGEFEYRAKHGDYAARIASRFAVPDKILVASNKLPANRVLRDGEKIQINNLHIVPPTEGESVLINLPQRMLFQFDDDELDRAYAVGLGKPDWPTPSGRFRIINRQENKAWIVPKSIQEEMAREGKVVLTEVPPGPKNPLGKHWLGLSLPGIGIHGTIAPVSVFRYRSHGCIRMHPDDISELFGKVSIGMEGRIIYATVLMAQLPDGRIFLEVHHDIYKKGADPFKIARQLAKSNNIDQQIDWKRADAAIRRTDGVAIEVTRDNGTDRTLRNDVWLKHPSLQLSTAVDF